MAEALAAFGVACNFMQLIGFVKDSVHVCKTIYQTGSLDPNLAQTTEYLTTGLEKLESSLGQFQPLGADEQELVDIAQGSLVTARELKSELERISGGSSKGKHTAAVKAWAKAVFGGKRRIEKLEKVMRDRQWILESRILLRVCNKNDALHIQQNEGFDRLETVFQTFIQARALDQTALEQLISSEGTAVKTHIDKKTETLVAAMQKHSIHEKLIGSLKHEAMNNRRNLVMKNHNHTLSWIFQTNDEKTENDNQIDFVKWLHHPNSKTYLISGKAGSGKSVLMKLLINHPSTQSILDDSNGSTLILSHFLWTAGQALEKNVKGILLSLVYQILTSNTDLCDLVLQKFPKAKQKDFPSDWSNEELRDVFLHVLAAFGKHICLFLDGIDELDANEKQYFFSTVLKDFSNMPRLQICVSGRPEPEVQRYFGSCPRLQVQDLTRLDIKKYARDSLKELNFEDAETIERLITEICRKASGVFLWVALALKSIQTGYSNNDDPAELEHRLRLLPSDLNALYQQMWHRLNDSEVIYRETAAQYFNLILECLDNGDLFRTPNILLLALALNPEIPIKVLNNGYESLIEGIDRECERIRVHLPIRCAGILEITKEGEVILLHRSAQEFLVNTPQGQAIRGADKVPSETRLFNLAQALLACIKVTIECQNQHSLKVTSRVLDLCKCFDNDGTNAIFILSDFLITFVVKNRLSSDRVYEFLHLAESLYETGWIFDCTFSLRPDFLGAIAMLSFLQQVSEKLCKLSSDAPEGMRVSDIYKLYIFGRVVELLPLNVIITRDPGFFSSFKSTRKEIHHLPGSLNILQFSTGIREREQPPFYLTSDPLTQLLVLSLSSFLSLSYRHLALVIRILENGYNLFTKIVILLKSSDLKAHCLFDRDYSLNYEDFSEGTLFIELNTIFLLNIFVRLLEGKPGHLSNFFDFADKVGRLKTVVSNLKPSASARLLAFTTLVPEKSDHTKSTDETLEAISVEKSSNDIHYGGEYFSDDNAKANDQVSKQPGDSDDSDSGHDESDDSRRGDFEDIKSPDFENWLWKNSIEVHVPLNKLDSDFVLEAIFGNNFAPLQCSGGEANEFGNLMAPELESRLQQISLRAKLSTLSRLQETLVEAGFVVPREKVADVWPPSVYEPESDDEETRSQFVALEKFLGW